MVFSSLFFIFVFLVLCYGLYLFMPTVRARNNLLLLFSLVFYAFGGPALVLLLCLETLICFFGAHLIWAQNPFPTVSEGNPRFKKLCLWVTVGSCLGLLVLYKYTGFLAGTVTGILGVENPLPAVTLPIGISFYTFQLISYVVDVYRNETPPQRSYGKLLLYAALFHQCIAGPIVRYVDVARELNHRTVTLDETWRGIVRFTVGLCKKAVLANTCALIADTLLVGDKLAAGSVSSLGILVGMTGYMLHIYLDFSAYSDMAIGMGMMIGFHFKENFNYPYAADSVTDFWRRWHISLSTFFRDYVYIPLGGNRCSKGRHILNLLIVWALTGFWHGASWNFILWGLYFALFLVLEKFLFGWKGHAKGFARHLRRLYTLVVVWFGWMLFRFDDMKLLGQAIKSLAGLCNGFNGDKAHFTLLNYIFFLALAMVACSPIVPRLSSRLASAAQGKGPLSSLSRAVIQLSAVAIPLLLLCLSILALVGDSYNPFLYFRF